MPVCSFIPTALFKKKIKLWVSLKYASLQAWFSVGNGELEANLLSVTEDRYEVEIIGEDMSLKWHPITYVVH